jgi:hypothetical protein
MLRAKLIRHAIEREVGRATADSTLQNYFPKAARNEWHKRFQDHWVKNTLGVCINGTFNESL